MAGNKKAGPITLALGLIFFGGVLLISNVSGIGFLESALKLWPTLLIGLGIEYFVKSYINRGQSDQEGSVRFHLPTVIIILLVTLIGYSGQQVAGLFKENQLNTFINEAIAGTNFNYKYNFESKPIDVKPGVTKVKVDNLQGKVDLVPSPDGKLRVFATIVAWGPSEAEAKRRAEVVKIDISEGNVINISHTPPPSYNNHRPADVAYRLQVPKGISVGVASENGNIMADSLEVNLDIRAANGEVALAAIKGNVTLNGQNGQVSLDNIDGTLDARMLNGNLRIKDVSKDIRAQNENGTIDVLSTRPVSSKYDLSNRTGEIIVRIPEASDATVSARTGNGLITGSLILKTDNVNLGGSTEPPGSGAKVGVVLGTGKGSINLYNETGRIVVDKN
ncbi:MAG: DUF4097 family beta strand repeat-containing protein [Eubacteriales bacterium]